MYKKITHNITEEHYAHPLAAELKKSVEKKIVSQEPMPSPTPPAKYYQSEEYYIVPDGSLGLEDKLPQYVLNEETMLFRMDARTAFAKWAWGLVNYAIAIDNDVAFVDQVKSRFTKSAVTIGDLALPYYGVTAGTILSDALIGIGDVGIEYATALKEKARESELEAISDKWTPLITDTAKVLAELNPNNWPEKLLVDILTNLVGAWKDELVAKFTKDFTADEIAIDRINKLVVTGVPDHHSAGFSSLADVFSRGVIAQFPSMFQD